ncbi:hypothetical protein [Streptomyces sp. NPDC003247]|uniref:hypothetical protein n=1 Tax=Streptomyces sp. NPDC003247 TaxID=3364677 RepID=UPI0036AAFE2A
MNSFAATPSSHVSFRLGVWQRALPIALGILGGTLFLYVVLAVTHGGMPTPGELRQMASVAPLAVVVATFLQRRDGVILTPDALVVAGLRRRRIAWAHIQRLEVRRSLGWRQVIVWTVDGRGTTLRAPASPGDPDFEAKVRTLVEWWETRRSTPAG